MKKYQPAILLAIVSIIGLFVFWQFQIKRNPKSPFGNKLQTVSLSGHSLSAEVVTTQEKKALGLSGRESLCADCAMLFLYEEKSIYPFWMKDMRFDLDMVWILGNKVVYLAKNVPFAGGTAKTINPGTLADKVLEINAGASNRLGIKVGDLVSL